MEGDQKNFYLNNLLNIYDYMRLVLNLISEEIILQYKLLDISEHVYV